MSRTTERLIQTVLVLVLLIMGVRGIKMVNEYYNDIQERKECRRNHSSLSIIPPPERCWKYLGN
jgi:hypothetical protein